MGETAIAHRRRHEAANEASDVEVLASSDCQVSVLTEEIRLAVGEAATRLRRWDALSQARHNVERAAWEQEREHFATSSSGPAPSSSGIDLSALRARAAEELAHLQSQMEQLKPLEPVEALLSNLYNRKEAHRANSLGAC